MPTCIPARAALLTGMGQREHGRVGYQNAVRRTYEATLPRVFRDAGYQTQAIGKMHVYPERARLGFDDVRLHDGYLHFGRGRSRPHYQVDDYLPWLRSQHGQSAVADYVDDGLHPNSMVARPWDKPESVHPTTWCVTEAIQWLYRRDPTMPFFLFVSFHRPHPPFDPPAWAYEQYLTAEPYRPVVGDWAGVFEPFNDGMRHTTASGRMRADVPHRARARYFGHMTHIDLQVNRFLEALAEFGCADDTVVCFVSDHGEMLGEHHLFQKGLPYEGAANIPFLIAGPGVPAGQVREVMPTLLDAAGVPWPGETGGRSVLDLMTDGMAAQPWRLHLHGEHPAFGQALHFVVEDGWKYVWFSGSGHEQLFDLGSDPRETTRPGRVAHRPLQRSLKPPSA